MKNTVFVVLWLFVFAVSYTTLSFLDMIPVELSEAHYRIFERAKSIVRVGTSETQASVASTTDTQTHEAPFEAVLPQRVRIEKISVDAPVLNPETRDVGVLDRALLDGVVRYPGSGGLDDESNMFLFGHSTGFSVVRNQAFKAFNRLDELQIGDLILVYADSAEYRYVVSSVSRVDSDDALVEFKTGKKMLTLSTCDTFGEKSDRFVVKADFIGASPLPRSGLQGGII